MVPWLSVGFDFDIHAVHCGPIPILMEADFHSRVRDLLDYGWRSLVLLLQQVIASCASILTLALSEEQLIENFSHGEKYH